MNNARQINRVPIVRFKRWSRRAYAIFSSLGKIVSIGFLKEGICRKALQKQGMRCSPFGVFDVCELIEREEPTEEQVSFQEQVFICEVFAKQSVAAAAVAISVFVNIEDIRLLGLVPSNLFLFN